MKENQMLIAYSKFLGRYPIQRFIFTSIIATFVVTVLLYITMSEYNLKSVYMNRFNIKTDYYNPEEDVMIYANGGKNRRINPEMDKLMDDRRQYLKEQCHALGLDQNGTIYGNEYLINEKYGVIWCSIFKAASSTWYYNFNRMAGYTEKECDEFVTPFEKAREIYIRPTEDELEEANSKLLTMLIVRHPFERLSSAYRDKFQNCPEGDWCNVKMDEIKARYRKIDPNKKPSDYPRWPTFKEFVMYILNEVKSKTKLDMHWTTFTEFCSPCYVDFDVIMKCETLEEEQKYLIERANLHDVAKVQCINSGKDKTFEANKKSSDLLQLYYSELSTEDIDQLYELYKYDLQLFNYSIAEYYNYVTTTEATPLI